MSGRGGRATACAGWALALATFGCADAYPLEPSSTAASRGEQLFLRGLGDNAFTCATCHRTRPTEDDERVLPGAELGGVTERPSYWGGAEVDLLRALGYCQTRFMGVDEPLAASDPEAGDLYAFLASLPGSESAVPFTVVRTVTDVPPGDAARGAGVFDRACKGCHGERDTGEGALALTIPKLPGGVQHEHGEDEHGEDEHGEDEHGEDEHGNDALERRLVFVEKVRHGVFLGYGGEMPPFSLEVLPDADLSDLLSALALDVDVEEP